MALLEWGPGAVTIAVFESHVPALIKIVSSQRVAMNVSFLNWARCPGICLPVPAIGGFDSSQCSRLMHSLHTLLHSLEEIIKYSQDIRTA